MKRDELTQGFGISGSQHLATWNQQKKLRTLNFTSAVMILAISSVGNSSSAAASYTDGRFAPAESEPCLKRSPQQVQFLQLPVAQHQRRLPKRQRQRRSLSAADKSRKHRSLLVQTPTTSVPLFPTALPPANHPIQQNGVVTVPPVHHPEASMPSSSTLTIPPATLPPPAFSTNQTPAVSVPPLQPIPTQTPMSV